MNATYVALIWELNPGRDASAWVRRRLRWRSLTTLGAFAVAATLTIRWPPEVLTICILCLAVYLKPEAK